MEQKLRVMVAEKEIEQAAELKGYLEKKKEMEEVIILDDGMQAYELMKTWKPDAVVMDLSLKHMGALDIMEKINSEQEAAATAVYLLANEASEELIGKAYGLGVSYYLLKPCSQESIYRRIISKTGKLREEAVFLAGPEKEKEEEDKRLEEEVTEVIRELGIPAHIKGYHYIRESILLAVKDMQILNYITKLLYPTIAKKYKTTSSSVERAIRHAIEVAFSRGKADLIEEMFGRSGNRGRTKPTNSEFIAVIADKLRLKAEIR